MYKKIVSTILLLIYSIINLAPSENRIEDDVIIDHNPPEYIIFGEKFEVLVTIKTNRDISYATLHYYSKLLKKSSIIPLEKVSINQFKGIIPAYEIQGDSLNYSFKFTDIEGKSIESKLFNVNILSRVPKLYTLEPFSPLPTEKTEPKKTWYKKWWIWPLVSAVVVGTGTAIALSVKDENGNNNNNDNEHIDNTKGTGDLFISFPPKEGETK